MWWRIQLFLLCLGCAGSKAEERPDDLAAWIHHLKTAPGNLKKGALVFEKNCSSCHHPTPDSGSPGPILSTLKNGLTLEKLLTTHLSPGRPPAEGYQATLFILNDGETATGIIDLESAEEITLRTPQGFRTLKAAEIDNRKTLASTLKPPGLFDAMKVSEIRDLAAWVTSPNPASATAVPLTKNKEINNLITWLTTGTNSPSTAAPQIQHLEAEDLKAHSTGGTTLRRNMTPFPNSHWSGNHILKWSQIEPGYQLHLPFRITEAGHYRMGGVFVRAAHYMTAKITLDDEKEPLIPALDLYHPTVVPTTEIELFHRHLPAGEHRLTFTIVGANPMKRNGDKNFSIDFFTLKKTSSPTRQKQK